MRSWLSRFSTAGLAFVLAGFPAPVDADVVLEWNAIAVRTVTVQNPFAQARTAAMTQLAVFEAVNAIEGGFAPYLGTVPAAPGASAEAAAIAAAHGVLRALVPDAAADLDLARNASLSAIPDGTAKTRGIAAGEAAAAAILAARADDGAAPPAFFQPSSTAPGEWQVTPSCPPGGGVLLHWGSVTPFGVKSSRQFRAVPPPSLRSHRYAKDYKEVKEVGATGSTARTQAHADVAQFYNVVLAVGTWNPVATQIIAARGKPKGLAARARVLALLNMAISDGLVTVMETKYHYRFWRPETAIRNGDADGNRKTVGDASFTPFITSPCFPSYPSAHAAGSYAGRTVLALLLGDEDDIDVTLSTSSLPSVLLEYTSLEEITDDIDDARVYGGIHFRFDQRAGAKMGRRVGEFIVRNQLKPTRGHKGKKGW
ncbi:MAG TPA: vanadium-dependent haloperoxidase [Vicinamibacterales bacterium]